MWFKEANIYFCKIENFAYGEINERSFSNPHPRALCQSQDVSTSMKNTQQRMGINLCQMRRTPSYIGDNVQNTMAFTDIWVLSYIDGLVQDCSNSIANALELLQSCTSIVGWPSLCILYDHANCFICNIIK